jgi:hypothetical protein
MKDNERGREKIGGEGRKRRLRLRKLEVAER